MLTEEIIVAPAISPVANINTTVTSAYISTRGGNFISFLLTQKSAGTNTGTSTITVLAASDTSGTGATAVPFRYRKKTTAVTSDQWGAVGNATAAGFATTANEDTLYEIEVDPASFAAAGVTTSKPFVALKLTQLVADTVLGSAIAVVQNPRFAGQTIPTLMA
jgi:hypothetical protein